MKSFRHISLIVGALVLWLPLEALAQDSAGFSTLTLAQAQAQSQSSVQPPAQAATATQDSSDLSKLQSDLKSAQDKLKDWPNLGRYHDAI